jgi:curved DNA-binding protein CbpA
MASTKTAGTAAGCDEHANLYELLGVRSSDAPEVIKSAYQKRILQYHPDKVGPASTEDSVMQFQFTLDAWKILGDPVQRAAYDRKQAALSTALMAACPVGLHLFIRNDNDTFQYPCRCGDCYEVNALRPACYLC